LTSASTWSCQDGGQRVLGARVADLVGQRLVAERGAVEEAESSDDRVDRARLEAAGQEVKVVVADVAEIELIGRPAMVAGQAGDGIGVDAGAAG
jgi:hypothetical protein